MKIIILISMLITGSLAQACRMTNMQASHLKIAAASEYVMNKYSLSEQSLIDIKSVRNVLEEVFVEIEFMYETPVQFKHVVNVNINSDCSTMVTESTKPLLLQKQLLTRNQGIRL